MTRRFVCLALVLAFALVAGNATASPISYINPTTLIPGQIVTDVNTQTPGDFDVPDGADFWKFFAIAGQQLNIQVDRTNAQYDPAMWIFEGLFADTSAFGAFFDDTFPADPGFIGFFDDNDPAALPPPPPFFFGGDPHALFVAPKTGFYTLAVTNSLSGLGPYSYSLQAVGITQVETPEPASMILLGTGLMGIAYRVRRQKSMQHS